MENTYIFAIVGHCRAGKTTLTTEVFFRLFTSLDIILSATTRPPRDSDDNLFYDFMDEITFAYKERQGDFLESTEFGEHRYGLERKHIDAILKERSGICIITEHGVLQLDKAGYPVVPIRIKSFGNDAMIREFYRKNPERERDDKARERLRINFKRKIANNFEKGGREEAVKELVNFISGYPLNPI